MIRKHPIVPKKRSHKISLFCGEVLVTTMFPSSQYCKYLLRSQSLRRPNPYQGCVKSPETTFGSKLSKPSFCRIPTQTIAQRRITGSYGALSRNFSSQASEGESTEPKSEGQVGRISAGPSGAKREPTTDELKAMLKESGAYLPFSLSILRSSMTCLPKRAVCPDLQLTVCYSFG